MSEYSVYATGWDDPHIVEQVPARGLSFNLPLSDHGECSFSATVEPGGGTWRAAIAKDISGVLVTRDTVPVWSGWVRADRQTGPRSFSFTAREWGSFFAYCPAMVGTWTGVNDHVIFRDQISNAQAIAGQDVQVQLGTTLGAALSDLTVNSWDNADVEKIFRQIAEADRGPEWYFGTAGTLDNPVRQLVLGDRLGSTTALDTIEYVEDTQDPGVPGAPPRVALLGDLFPAGTTVPALRRRGGNAIAAARNRASDAATVAVALGDGVESAQIPATAEASTLLGWGWPRLTVWKTYSSVLRDSTLQRHADGDLRSMAGFVTAYDLVTLDQWVDVNGEVRGGPDWTQVPRGSTMQVSLDTDVYAGPRPHTFDSRVYDIRVDVPDDGPAQIQWGLAEVLET